VETCFVYMTDAALEKTIHGRYYLDVLIVKGYTTSPTTVEVWNFHNVVAKDEPLF